MANLLFNHTNAIKLNSPELIPFGFNPLPPDSKRLRSDMGPYPGDTPYLTDRIPSSFDKVNLTDYDKVNGRVQITLQSRTRDQKYVNKYQFAFVDVSNENKAQLVSLSQLNEKLATSVQCVNMDLNTVLHTFRLFGLISNNDTDIRDEATNDRGPRATTVTTWGSGHVYDYWSSSERMLRPYDACYFILKRVRLDPTVSYQSDLTVTTHNTGKFIPPDAHNAYVWQVIPYAINKETLDKSLYTTVIKTKTNIIKYVGTYWKVGHVHEYAEIANKDVMSIRKSTMDVARDVSYLHMSGLTRPMQFYMRIEQPKFLP